MVKKLWWVSAALIGIIVGCGSLAIHEADSDATTVVASEAVDGDTVGYAEPVSSESITPNIMSIEYLLLLWSEDFQSLAAALMPLVTGDLSNPKSAASLDPNIIGILGWTPTPPTGWSVDNSGVSTVGNPNAGVLEWEGWSFVTQNFWVARKDGGRSSFLPDEDPNTNIIAVADADQWDDYGDPNGEYITVMSTHSTAIAGTTTPLQFSFDSSWSGSFQQGTIQMVYTHPDPNDPNNELTELGNAILTLEELLNWNSDPTSSNFKAEALNETVTIELPPLEVDGTVQFFFVYSTTGGNGGWWAVDNVALGFAGAEPNEPVCAIEGNFTSDCLGGSATFDLQATVSDGTPPYTHDWSSDCNNATLSDVTTAATTLTLSGAENCGGAACEVTLVVTDANGLTSTCTQTVTVNGSAPPTIDTAAMDLTVECDGAGNQSELADWIANDGGATASSGCGDVTWTNEVVGTEAICGGAGKGTVTFIATDPCGKSASTTATFTIADATAPTIDVEASDMTVECDGAGNSADLTAWLDSHGGAQASDTCGTVTWSNDYTGLSDGCGATGSTTVTFTADDGCGNSATTTATFTIVDNTPLTIDTPASDLTVECDGAGNTADFDEWMANNGGAKASDICGTVTWSSNVDEFIATCVATDSAKVTFTATDECGASVSTTATFMIADTTDPVIDTPASDLTVECDGMGNTDEFDAWVASNGGAVASDVCSGVTWSYNVDERVDGCAASGSATVTFTVTDECGLSSSTTATFMIEDTTDPNIVCPADATVECGAPTDPNALGYATAEDVCDPNIVITYEDVTESSDSPLDPVDFTITRTWTATDACGNTSHCDQVITVLKLVLDLEIKGGACPAPFNPTSNGVTPIVLLGSDSFDVSEVDLTSLRLLRADGEGLMIAPNEGPPGPHTLLVDIGAPSGGEPCACDGSDNDDSDTDSAADGWDDVSMKFSSEAMADMLWLDSVPNGETVELVLTGSLTDGCRFVASDCVTIVPPKEKKSK